MKKTLLLFISVLFAVSAGFAQIIPNGGFESWTNSATPISWSSSVTINTTGCFPSSNLINVADSTKALSQGNSAIAIYSANVPLLSKVIPGISISGANASAKIAQNLAGTSPSCTASGSPTITYSGSFTITPGNIPAFLIGTAKYKTNGTDTAAIAIMVFSGSNTVGGYSPTTTPTNSLNANVYPIPSTTKTSFRIPITMLGTSIDSVRLILTTGLPSQAQTAVLGDTLWVDSLAFVYTPQTPTVTANGHVLTSSAATGNQWYLNGVALTGETSSTFTVTQTGSYTDIVTIDGVSSSTSSPVLLTAISNVLDRNQFDVSQNNPNPFSGTTSISFSTPNSGTVQFTVVDLLGRVVNSQTINANAGINTITYAAGYDSGTYFYTISDSVHSLTKKLVVSK